MKLGTLKDGTRDGVLVVVSRDHRVAVPADHVAPTLKAALDDWDYCAPQLATLYEELNRAPSSRAFEVDFTAFAAALPRASQWLDASAYANHVELARRARGSEIPRDFASEPLMYQGVSDPFLGPCEDLVVESEEFGIDLEAEIAVITGDVPCATRPDRAGEHIRLLVLVNDVSLRELLPAEAAKGYGFLHSKPPCAMSALAVSPDEFGEAWHGGKLHAQIEVTINGHWLGHPNSGVDMAFSFYRLIAHAARTRPLPAGTVVGAGTVSNRDRSVGSACLLEKRALETIASGEPATAYLRFDDRLHIDARSPAGQSLFGAIDQRVARPAT